MNKGFIMQKYHIHKSMLIYALSTLSFCRNWGVGALNFFDQPDASKPLLGFCTHDCPHGGAITQHYLPGWTCSVFISFILLQNHTASSDACQKKKSGPRLMIEARPHHITCDWERCLLVLLAWVSFKSSDCFKPVFLAGFFWGFF